MEYNNLNKIYKTDFLDLYHCDCMELLRQTPDNYYSLALVDPPYGIGAAKEKPHNGWVDWGVKQWDNESPKAEYFTELKRVSKNQILFGANHYIEVVPYNSSCWLVWDKMNGDSYYADCELAWTSFETATRKIKCKWGGANSHREGKRIHATQKPIALYRFLLEKYAEKGQRILDTHLGSGSSRIAAYKMGFDFVGFEIDAEMCKQSEMRFNNALLQSELSFV